jgi:hypothetical protein
LPAPASNTTRTIQAFAEEDFENPDPSCDVSPNEDTWTLSVNVSVVTLRN